MSEKEIDRVSDDFATFQLQLTTFQYKASWAWLYTSSLFNCNHVKIGHGYQKKMFATRINNELLKIPRYLSIDTERSISDRTEEAIQDPIYKYEQEAE